MTRYARIVSGVVVELLDTTTDIAKLFPPDLVWVPAGIEVKERWTLAAGIFTAPVSPSFDLEGAVVQMVQARLDTFARTRAYDGILSACSYAPSTVATFAAEGLYCVKARDAHWGECYQLLAEVQAGKRVAPSVDEVMALMPALVWPA